MKVAWTYVVIAAIAFLAALDYELFVFPNQFAPSGLNGICTMIQYLTGVSVGYLSLLVNVPLAIWCYVEVSKPLAYAAWCMWWCSPWRCWCWTRWI